MPRKGNSCATFALEKDKAGNESNCYVSVKLSQAGGSSFGTSTITDRASITAAQRCAQRNAVILLSKPKLETPF